MFQSINLLPLIPTRPKLVYSAGVMLKVSIAWGILLVIVFGIGFASTKWQANTLKTLVAKKDQLSQQVAEIKPQLANVQTGAKSIEDINQELRDVNRMINTLSSKTVDTKQGFSNYFDALATYTPNDVWLSYIESSRTDQSSLIKGFATTPSAIPEFISELKQSPEFKGDRFDALKVSVMETKPDIKKVDTANKTEQASTTIPHLHFELSAHPVQQQEVTS